MEILRVWRNQAVGGAAAAALVPGVILVAALGVGITGGGLASLGSVRQALTGPDVPKVEPRSVAPGGRLRDPGRLLARSLPARERGGGSAAGAVTGGSGSSAAGSPGQAPSPPAPTPESPSPGSRTSPPTSRPPAAPTPAPTATPSPIRQVGDRVTQVTDEVPVAGEPTGDVVDVLVDTVDHLLSP